MMNSNGSGVVQISSLRSYSDLSWAPDGSKILINYYDSEGSKTSALYIVPVANGGGPTRVTSASSFEQSSSWAPSPKIVWEDAGAIFVANSDASGLVKVTQDTKLNQKPRITDDGAMVVYSSVTSGHRELWAVSSTGGTPKQITHNTINDYGDVATDISPDGLIVAFTRSVSDSVSDLGVIRVDGGGERIFNIEGKTLASGAKFSGCP